MDSIPSEDSSSNEQHLIRQYGFKGVTCSLGRPGRDAYEHFNKNVMKECGDRLSLTERNSVGPAVRPKRLIQDSGGRFPMLNEIK